MMELLCRVLAGSNVSQRFFCWELGKNNSALQGVEAWTSFRIHALKDMASCYVFSFDNSSTV